MNHSVFMPALIKLPQEKVDLSKWAVLACDQYTSQPEYWENVNKHVGDAPSTLRLVLPEAYLESDNTQDAIQSIHTHMEAYVENVLKREIQGFVYVERHLQAGVRQGLVGCVDLEAYDYKPGKTPAIRPSENTVEDRIPPRLAVRRGAKLETPHILMLCDDVKQTVIEPLAAQKANLEKVYDFDLMENGGRIEGWAVTDPNQIQQISIALENLADRQAFQEKYKTPAATAPFVLAVGDGNHSLATAKAAWEEIKPQLSQEDQSRHPARFCLVELENVQSPANQIEPIHRIIMGASADDFMVALGTYTRQSGAKLAREGPWQWFDILQPQKEKNRIFLENTPLPLTVATVEAIIEICLQQNKNIKVDYIHGEASLQELVNKGQGIGILLPPFDKTDLFRGVALGGTLPKKTFSMGHAHEKRYYLECRQLY